MGSHNSLYFHSIHRKRKEVEENDDGFYMVSNEKGELKVVRGGLGLKNLIGNWSGLFHCKILA